MLPKNIFRLNPDELVALYFKTREWQSKQTIKGLWKQRTGFKYNEIMEDTNDGK